ncbi:hypothetical protein HDU91_003618 [Kappamyces sp. JEL0680]|nr:hypothetical protein HDU91_003618 [Kappamyces sp. JEL0680]
MSKYHPSGQLSQLDALRGLLGLFGGQDGDSQGAGSPAPEDIIAQIEAILGIKQSKKPQSPRATPTPSAGSDGASNSTLSAPATPGKNGQAPAASGTGSSIALVNKGNELFTAAITLGNGQVFNLDLDTGSSDTWTRGPNCQARDASCTGKKANLQDKTLKPLNAQFQTNYGSGAVIGQIVEAPVTLNGLQATLPIGISEQEVGFRGTDGLMGLAFDSISKISRASGQNANIMDALFGKGKNNVISFFLSNAEDKNNQGEVTFGGLNPARFTGQLQALPLNSASFWQFDFSGTTFSVNGVSGDAAGSFTNAIADSGTSLMILDDQSAAAINQAIGAQPTNQGVSVFADCQKALQGSDLVMTIQGKKFAIPASIYVISNGGNSCFSGITGGGGAAAGGLAILGDTFMRAQYTVFDKANKQVLFAPAVHN